MAQTSSPGPHPIFVLNSLDANVSLVDPATWSEIRRFDTGKQPHHLYFTPDEKSLIIANALGNSLTFVDPRTGEVQRTVRGIMDPYQLRFSPDRKWFVTLANRLNHVDFYRWDGNDPVLVKRVLSSRTPSHLWIDSRSTTVYASMQDSDELVALDLPTQTVKWRVLTGPMPADVFGTPDDRFLFVALTGGDGVDIFDVSGPVPHRVKTLKTGLGAHSFRALGDGRHVLVSNRAADTISKIDYQAMTVTDEYPAPGGPDDMELTPDRRFIYVASRWAKKLSVVDTVTRQVVKRVKVGNSPHGIWTVDHAPRQ